MSNLIKKPNIYIQQTNVKPTIKLFQINDTPQTQTNDAKIPQHYTHKHT